MAELSEQQEQELSGSYKSHKSRSGFWFGIIILLIIFSVAGAGFYLFMQLRAQQDDLGGELNKDDQQLLEFSKQMTAFQSQLATLSSDIASKDSHFTKTLDSFSQLHNERLETTRKELTESIQQLQRQLGKTRGDWLIADAEYLLVAASERLHLVGDINTTRQALEAADKRLEESGDAGVIKVREEIAKELAQIKSIKVPDIVGIYASINSLAGQVDQLTLILPYTGKKLSPAVKAPEKSEDESGLIGKLKDVVTIRHNEQAIDKILTEEEAQFIYGQLKVKLEMTKIMLVQHNESLYRSGLDDAKSWLEKHFIKNKEYSALAEELDKLSAIKIKSQFPDISKSLNLIRDISKLRIESEKDQKPDEAPQKPAPGKKPAVLEKPAEIEKPAEAPKAPETEKPMDAPKPAEPAPAPAIDPAQAVEPPPAEPQKQ